MRISVLNIKKFHVSLGVLVLGLLFLGGCSSDDDEVADVPATVPVDLNYEIRQGTGVSLVLSQNPQVTVTSTQLTGSYNRNTLAFTLNVQPDAMNVSAADFLSQLDSDLGTDFSNYSLHVTEDVAWVGDDNPSSGVLEIYDDPVRKITISVVSTGVEITYWPNGADDPSSSQTDSLTWEEFDSVFGEPTAESYTQIAAFAHSLLRFMYEQGDLVIQALELIGENDTLLEETGSVEESCDVYPLPPSPAVANNPGLIRVNWYDADNSIDLGPGDTVYLSFIECWDDDESDNFDTLYDGGVNLVNYTEVESGGVLTRIGFEPSSTSDGGIVYDNLKITETETTDSNVDIKVSEEIMLSGSFSMVFTSP
jgi:hypothetical protein